MSCTGTHESTDASTAAFVKTDTEHVPRWPNFFDGRVLTAEVMRSQREAVREHLRFPGLALGPGVVEGLTVSLRDQVSLDIAAGTAINGEGDVLRLVQEVTLTIPTSEEAARQRALFSACRREPGEEVADAVYVLTARPCEAYRDRDPRVSNGTGGTGILGCGYKWLMEGITFELLELPEEAPHDATDPRFRNLLAFWCYHGADPWSGEEWRWREGIRVGDGGVDGLTDAHVPLAVLAWDGTRIGTLDTWAARREPGAPPHVEAWSSLVGTGPARLGKARFLGFQAFLEEEYGTALDSQEFQAFTAACRYWPPAFLVRLDLVPSHVYVEASHTMHHEPVTGTPDVTPEEVRLAVERSFLADPIDLDAIKKEPTTGEQQLPYSAYRIAAGATQVRPWYLVAKHVRGVLPFTYPTWMG